MLSPAAADAARELRAVAAPRESDAGLLKRALERAKTTRSVAAWRSGSEGDP